MKNPSKSSRLLLVLDINGTLVDRLKKKEKRLAALNPRCPSHPTFRLSGDHFYARPYLDVFLEEIFSLFEVAVWTSMIPQNANQVSQKVFGNYTGQLCLILNRSHCVGVKEGKDHESIKDLRILWDSTKVKTSKTNASRQETRTGMRFFYPERYSFSISVIPFCWMTLLKSWSEHLPMVSFYLHILSWILQVIP